MQAIQTKVSASSIAQQRTSLRGFSIITIRDFLRRTFSELHLRDEQKMYILTLIVGALCGLAAVSYHMLLEFFQDNIIYHAAALQVWYGPALVILIPAIGGLVAGAGLYYLVPEARGSGIPQVKASFMLGGGNIPRRVIWGKMFLSSFNIGTGASLGREGPTVQICAAIASWLGRLFRLTKHRLESLVPVGAAAGLAAAFNTPIAAVTFTLEEILGDAASRPLGSIVIAAVIASVIERGVLGAHPLFIVPPYGLNNAIELVYYAILGVVAGFASIAFNEGLLALRRWFLTQKQVPQWATPGVGGFILGIVGLIAVEVTGSSSIFGVGYGQLSVALQMPLPLQVLIILGVFKLVGTVLSYGSGSSGGIFGPSLYIGGMVGGAIGLLAQFAQGNASTVQPGAFALVGMGAVFAGIVRAPVTSIVIIFEMTNNYSIILPLMIANIISYAVATRVSPTPIYDALLIQDGVHLPRAQHHVLRRLRVTEAMTRDVTTVDALMTVRQTLDHVIHLQEHHHGYPILDHEGKLIGLCTFKDLKRAIAHELGDEPVGTVFKKRLTTVYPEQALDSAINRLGKNGYSQLPVVDHRNPTQLLGILTMHDVARALAREEGTIQTAEHSARPSAA